MTRDLTGLAYLVALGLVAFVGYKLYKGGQVAVAALADQVHSFVQSVGAPIEAATTGVLDAIITEPPAVRNINAPVDVPPPAALRQGSALFPSGKFVGDLEDVSPFYGSDYALHRDRDAINNANAPGAF